MCMEQTYLLDLEERDCPLCNKVHVVEKRKRLGGVLIKNEPVRYDEIYYLCPDCSDEEENEFVSAELMNENLQTARDAYRKLHGLLTSREIAQIRELYHMSQADFSTLLGWGEVTVTRYETKTIQDETYDQILQMAKNDPYFVMERLRRQREKFTEEKYEMLRKSVERRIDEVGAQSLNRKTIESKYLKYEEPSEWNGYQGLNLEKLQSVISFFASYYGSLFKVKLMKLLWYVDALAFRVHGRAITGLVYTHMPYGALPIAHAEIIHLHGLSVEEIEKNDTIMYRITSSQGASLVGLNADEIDIVYRVAKYFRTFTTQQIVDHMHGEEAYLNTEMYQTIPFSLCERLHVF